jgi:hypothetical protein
MVLPMTAWSNSFNAVQASQQLSLLNVEQQRLLNVNNELTNNVKMEMDARAEEKAAQDIKVADKAAKKIATKHSLEAADLAIWGAAINLIGTIASAGVKSARGGEVKWSKTFPDIFNGFGAVYQKFLEKQKLAAEDEAVGKDLARLQASQNFMGKTVAALNANPFI